MQRILNQLIKDFERLERSESEVEKTVSLELALLLPDAIVAMDHIEAEENSLKAKYAMNGTSETDAMDLTE